jgi:hypothetical protein
MGGGVHCEFQQGKEKDKNLPTGQSALAQKGKEVQEIIHNRGCHEPEYPSAISHIERQGFVVLKRCCPKKIK